MVTEKEGVVEFLTQECKSRGIRQIDLSKKLRVSRATAWHIMHGNMTLERFFQILEILNLSIAFINKRES